MPRSTGSIRHVHEHLYLILSRCSFSQAVFHGVSIKWIVFAHRKIFEMPGTGFPERIGKTPGENSRSYQTFNSRHHPGLAMRCCIDTAAYCTRRGGGWLWCFMQKLQHSRRYRQTCFYARTVFILPTSPLNYLPTVPYNRNSQRRTQIHSKSLKKPLLRQKDDYTPQAR